MQAKVKDSYPWHVARSGGVEFVKGEFRPVPLGKETEAENAAFLDTQKETNVQLNEVIASSGNGGGQIPPEVVDLPLQVEPTKMAAKVAKDHGISLSTVTGTGKDGKITVGDVKKMIGAENE